MAETLTREQMLEVLAEEGEHDPPWLVQTRNKINVWLRRGDGAAIYRNQAMDHSQFGRRKICSFGSPAAQLETEEPPQRLPDIGQDINWAYQLEATYRGEPL